MPIEKNFVILHPKSYRWRQHLKYGLRFHKEIMNNCMKTKVTFVDERRVLVETPSGDDFIVGFLDSSNYQIEKQSVFKITRDLGLLFDRYYTGDPEVIWGEINKQLMLHCYGSIFFVQAYDKALKDEERIRIGSRIRELRQERGLEAKAIAAVAGVDAANLCRIEAGKYSVGFDILTKIATALGKKVDFVDLEDGDHGCAADIRPQS